ncbi:hypothetical protein B0T16DRAFT_402913 [Cercophora newfieldiana]|uniref:C2H2-type domain-containing protein n=1 Tax=Cercophora newfieldiana TaxID=92897 RepID=A0AA39YSV5_9PEZI|nr:hypothetical protein B0T16DRAFT_402913 [Cercophora newfieldiana]
MQSKPPTRRGNRRREDQDSNRILLSLHTMDNSVYLLDQPDPSFGLGQENPEMYSQDAITVNPFDLHIGNNWHFESTGVSSLASSTHTTDYTTASTAVWNLNFDDGDLMSSGFPPPWNLWMNRESIEAAAQAPVVAVSSGEMEIDDAALTINVFGDDALLPYAPGLDFWAVQDAANVDMSPVPPRTTIISSQLFESAGEVGGRPSGGSGGWTQDVAGSRQQYNRLILPNLPCSASASPLVSPPFSNDASSLPASSQSSNSNLREKKKSTVRGRKSVNSVHPCGEGGCLETFTLEKDRRRHISTHHRDGPAYVCRCGKYDNRKDNFRRHIEGCIREPRAQPYRCSCGG